MAKNINLSDLGKRRAVYPSKRRMNLFYKPDRTTKPATIALYVLFGLALLLAAAKFMIYDLWDEVQQQRRALASVQAELAAAQAELVDYNQVWERYNRFAATDDERAIIDRIEVLALLDSAIGSRAQLNSIAINGDVVQVQFSGVTLAQTGQIVSALEASPLVAGTTVNTAATPQNSTAQVLASVYIQLKKEGASDDTNTNA